jgi:hypothetical protein
MADLIARPASQDELAPAYRRRAPLLEQTAGFRSAGMTPGVESPRRVVGYSWARVAQE